MPARFTRATGAALALVAMLSAPPRARGEQDLPAAEPAAESPDENETISDTEFQELSEDAVPIEATSAAGEPPEPGETAPVQPPGAQPTRRIFWDQGLRIERDGRFRLKIGGRFMLDAASGKGDSGIDREFDPDTDAEVRQARIDFTGTVGARVFFKAQLDLTKSRSGDSNRDHFINDFFIGLKGLGPLGTGKIGVIREPFSIDALSSGINLPFLERALPNAFAAGFNPGVLFENLALDGALHWQAGAFRYVGDDSDQNRTDIAARITGVPWSADEDARLLHVGGGYMLQTGQFELRLRQRPELHLAARWVDTKKFAADRAHVFGLEGAGAFGRMSFQSELMYSSVDAESGSSLAFWGGYAQVSLFLSEDRRPYVRRQGLFGRVHPSRPFDHRQGSWGAWELAARFSYVDLDDGEIRGGTLQDITLGLNWYPTAHLRVAFNYVRAHLNGVGTGNHLGLRCQFAY